ncbi:MAG: endonuclease/exonuclease/phosphatase family protein [Bryobacteraceae bacterium]|nr:endonuclease/exonuclease/phosphatase family protein [Bryobacteraceae bacterium]
MEGPRTTRRLKLLTYNIHSGIGRDGRSDLDRVRRILLEERADVAALQEIERSAGAGQVNELAMDLPATASFCETRPAGKGSFGLATLSPLRVVHCENYDLSYAGAREPRFCLRTDLEVASGAALHVFNCHLGLTMRERRFQRDRMLSDAILLSRDLRHPVVLMGDFNDSPFSVIHSSLRRRFQDAYRAAGRRWGPTFRLGVIPIRLDYIYVSPGIRVLDCSVRNDRLARVASDHLPVAATVEICWP